MNVQNKKLELDQQHQVENQDVKMFYIDELLNILPKNIKPAYDGYSINLDEKR